MYLRVLRGLSKRSPLWQSNYIQARWSSTKSSLPLRILFCGSDDLSAVCLKALYQEQQRDPEGIKSIDVLIRPAKPYGRSLKKFREVPIKSVAVELGLNIHERDTFTGWNLPTPDGKPINLIVAVSFGLFVPPRILQSAYYGGINVHPSLLPNYRGPAPLQHILMSKDTFTGVTLQTLDDKAFDHGIILAQTPQQDCKMPDLPKLNHNQLLERIAPIAAEQLVDGIHNRLFVPPLANAGWYKIPESSIVHARKLTKDDQQIDWNRSGGAIERQHRALGRLWNELSVDAKMSLRLIFEDMSLVPSPENLATRLNERQYDLDGLLKPHILDPDIHILVINDVHGEASEGHDRRKVLFYVKDEEDAIIIAANDKNAIRVKNVTIGGKSSKPAAIALGPFNNAEVWQLRKHKSNQTQAVPAKRVVKLFDGKSLGESLDNQNNKLRKYIYNRNSPRKLTKDTPAVVVKKSSDAATGSAANGYIRPLKIMKFVSDKGGDPVKWKADELEKKKNSNFSNPLQDKATHHDSDNLGDVKP